MLPAELNASHFKAYPPQARALAIAHLPFLRQLPLAFLSSLLREVIAYDYKFPVERAQLDRQLTYLEQLSPSELSLCFAGFARITLSAEQTSYDWCGRPFDFSEQLSAYLWRTHQMDGFRQAAIEFGNHLQGALPPAPLPMRRLGLAVIGQNASPAQPGLFQKLRPHGTLFTNLDPADGFQALLNGVRARAEKHTEPYAHWYVDGGPSADHVANLTSVSYTALAPTRTALLAYIQKQVGQPGMGPEELRDRLGHLSPGELGMGNDSLLDRFLVRVLTEGSGTQIFSTTFAQWTSREALRRAEPLTLLVRFAPRQRQRPMNELLANDQETVQLDPEGSLVDADMAAYYQWINQQRLPGSQESSFLVWFEGQRQALAISPGLPRQTEFASSMNLAKLLNLVAG